MSLNRFVELFITWLAGIHKTQVKTLAVLVFGLLRSPRLGVASLGRALPGPTAEKHRIKRVDRFLGNRRLQVGKCTRPLVQAIAGTRKRLFIAIDWTDLHDGAHQALVAGVVTRGRALPIWWQVTAKEQLTANQNRFEERFVARLRQLLPPHCEVIILADRGFARVSFLQKLEALGFKYVIRVQRNVWVEGENYIGVLGKLKVVPGTQRDMGLVCYQKQIRWPVRLVVRFKSGQSEPWWLVTNVTEARAERIADWYARRMEIEEFFRDIKNERAGFRLRGLVLRSTMRYNRLFLLIAYAYYLLTVVGDWAEKRQLHRRLMANTERKRVLGLWRVGYYIFRSWSSGRRGRCPWVFNTWPEIAYNGMEA